MSNDKLLSINDRLFQESKSLQSGSIPFPSYGSGWGTAPIYRSEEAWSSWIDNQYGNSGAYNIEKYRSLVGELSHHSLPVAAIRFLGDSIPEAPLVVKRKSKSSTDEGQKGESVVIPDHPLAQLWNRPNEFYSGSTLKRGLAFSLVLSSNAYVLKFKNKGRTKPMELWWEPHWTIRPVWPIDGSQFISYYEINRGGQWYKIDYENVIHIRDGIHPYNQRLGFSGNDSILRELFGDAEAANYFATLMGGSGIPGFMISIDKDLKMDQDKIEKFEKMIIAKTSGERKGSPLVARGARGYKLGFNPKEMDLRESRYMAEDRFCAIQGIPAVVLELGTGQAHSIYKNVEEAQRRAWRNYVCPKLTMIEEELNIQLLKDYSIDNEEDTELYCQHDLSQVQALQEDVDKKAERLSKLFAADGILRSELRSGMGYGPSDPTKPDDDKIFFSATKPAPILPPGMGGDETGSSPLNSKNRKFGKDATDLAEKDLKKKKPLLAAVKAAVAIAPTLTWVPYSEELNSLKIPRSSMPQVAAGDRGALVQFLKARGIPYTKEEVLPTILKPSQMEYSPEKVQGARDYQGGQRSIIVSADDYVLDGHHQWMADIIDAPLTPIPIIRLHTIALRALIEIARFPSSFEVESKALPSRSQFVDNEDIQETIDFLKEHRFEAVIGMLNAQPINEI